MFTWWLGPTLISPCVLFKLLEKQKTKQKKRYTQKLNSTCECSKDFSFHLPWAREGFKMVLFSIFVMVSVRSHRVNICLRHNQYLWSCQSRCRPPLQPILHSTQQISVSVSMPSGLYILQFGIGLWNSFTNAFQRILAQQNWNNEQLQDHRQDRVMDCWDDL